MRSLHLLRHAKSDWSDPSLRDFDRPLNKRGRKAAPRIAAEMREFGLAPELVLCSSAVRARQTWDLVVGPLYGGDDGRPQEVRFSRSLYLASPAKLLELIQRVESGFSSLLIIGHNPGMEHLADQLAGPESDPLLLQTLREKYPTAALACFELDIAEWSQVAPGQAKLVRFLTPRSLD